MLQGCVVTFLDHLTPSSPADWNLKNNLLQSLDLFVNGQTLTKTNGLETGKRTKNNSLWNLRGCAIDSTLGVVVVPGGNTMGTQTTQVHM